MRFPIKWGTEAKGGPELVHGHKIRDRDRTVHINVATPLTETSFLALTV